MRMQCIRPVHEFHYCRTSYELCVRNACCMLAICVSGALYMQAIRRLRRDWTYHAKCTRLYCFVMDTYICAEDNSIASKGKAKNTQHSTHTRTHHHMPSAKQERARPHTTYANNKCSVPEILLRLCHTHYTHAAIGRQDEAVDISTKTSPLTLIPSPLPWSVHEPFLWYSFPIAPYVVCCMPVLWNGQATKCAPNTRTPKATNKTTVRILIRSTRYPYAMATRSIDLLAFCIVVIVRAMCCRAALISIAMGIILTYAFVCVCMLWSGALF